MQRVCGKSQNDEVGIEHRSCEEHTHTHTVSYEVHRITAKCGLRTKEQNDKANAVLMLAGTWDMTCLGCF